MFDRLPDPVPDALHAVMTRYRADTRPQRIDLGVGVYRDAGGHSPVMRAVKAAEARLVSEQSSKAYQALRGNEAFAAAMTLLVFGDGHPAVAEGRVAAIQGTGGTGSLRIAMEVARLASGGAKVHLGLPSWPNHAGLTAATGLELVTHRYFDVRTQRVDADAVLAAAHSARAGDLFVLHGNCHNPTGADLSAEQRRAIIAALAERGAVPLIDAAYYGLGEGLEADLGFLRDAASAGRAFISVACSKSFGLYRERTGILFAICAGADERARVQGQMERISRTLVSMPPAHGAAAVATILDDPELRADWASELDEMRQRVLGLRAELAAQKVPLLAGVEHQRGIFRLLDITPEQSERLGRDHAIHMPASGRINIAGLKDGDARRLAVALQEVAEA